MVSSGTLTVDEAARFLGIGRNLYYELARRGEVPAIKLGKRWIVPRPALLAFLMGGFVNNGNAKVLSVEEDLESEWPFDEDES